MIAYMTATLNPEILKKKKIPVPVRVVKKSLGRVR